MEAIMGSYMVKNCVITLEPEIVDKAAEQAHKQGKSLKDVIEDTIRSLAKTAKGGPWITEKDLLQIPGVPSRVSLHQMRKDGRLQEGKHYKSRGRFLFYHKREVRKVLFPKPKSVRKAKAGVK